MEANLSHCFVKYNVHMAEDLMDLQLYAELGRAREWDKANLDNFLEHAMRDYQERKFKVSFG
jgi:hypothetical protein